MAFGVTYSALLANAVVTVELFLLTRNLLWLLACLPVHGLFWLLCLSEPRFFDLAMLWGKTRGPGLFGNARLWRAQGYSPLALDLPSVSEAAGDSCGEDLPVNAAVQPFGASATRAGRWPARAVHGAGGAGGRAHAGR